MLWVSDTPSVQQIRQGMLVNIYRTGYIRRHGMAQTLGEITVQEGTAAAFAGIEPQLDADDLAYSRVVLQPLLSESSYPLLVAALYGDTAARTLGYEPLGLSERAGLE